MRPTHAGGVVHRPGTAGPEVLLVTAMGAPHEWVLPKGRIKKRETPVEAAVREVLEECGVVATPDDEHHWCESSFTLPPHAVRPGRSDNVVVHYFAMTLTATAPAGEGRLLAWLPVADAIRRATHQSTRDVLRRMFGESQTAGSGTPT